LKTDHADILFLLENARRGAALGLDMAHLASAIGARNYVRIANDIARQTPAARLLDWGCGLGQMTYLLRRRGLTVTPYDLGAPDAPPPDLPLARGLGVIRSQERARLPFADGAFDAALSCGVLEHVVESGGDERASLGELRRVLRPGGRLFIYQLPQEHAWQEALIRRFKLGYAHPQRYTLPGVTSLLRETGFTVMRARRFNLIPKNLTGMPGWIRPFYDRCAAPLLALDGALCAIPLLNQLAGVLELTAIR